MLNYWSEADFEFNNYFVSPPGSHIYVGATAYRRYGGPIEGTRAGPVDCIASETGRLLPFCRKADGTSALADRWLLLVFRFDPDALTREGGRSYRGRLSFLVESDEPEAPGGIRGVMRGATRPFEIWRTDGQDLDDDGLVGEEGESPPIEVFMRDRVAILFSIMYEGRFADRPCPRAPSDLDATCQPHTLDVDWTYHTPALLSAEEVRQDVAMWRQRGVGRVNTFDLRPHVIDPPLRSAGAEIARLPLVLGGPAVSNGEGTWRIRPATPRGVI